MRWLSDLLGTKLSFSASFLKLTPQSAPSSPVAGLLYPDSGDGTLNLHDGSRFRKQLGLPYVLANTNNATLAVNTAYYIGSSVSTLNLPSSPSAGDSIKLVKSTSNAVTINSTINIDTDLGTDTSINFNVSSEIEFIYNGTTWRLNYTGPSSGSGGSSSSWSQSVICAGSQSVVTFPLAGTSFPSTLSDIELTISARATGSVGTVNCYLKFNGDGTAANYRSSQYFAGHGASATASTQASTTSGSLAFFTAGTLNTSHPVTSGKIVIPNYSGSVIEKSFSSAMQVEYDNQGNGESELITGHYLSTTPVSRLDISTSAGNSFFNGSVITCRAFG